MITKNIKLEGFDCIYLIYSTMYYSISYSVKLYYRVFLCTSVEHE